MRRMALPGMNRSWQQLRQQRHSWSKISDELFFVDILLLHGSRVLGPKSELSYIKQYLLWIFSWCAVRCVVCLCVPAQEKKEKVVQLCYCHWHQCSTRSLWQTSLYKTWAWEFIRNWLELQPCSLATHFFFKNHENQACRSLCNLSARLRTTFCPNRMRALVSQRMYAKSLAFIGPISMSNLHSLSRWQALMPRGKTEREFSCICD